MTIDDLISAKMDELSVSRYEAADCLMARAQQVMQEERENRIAELRKIANEGEAAAKELVELGAVGAPRKTAKKRSPRKKTEAVAG